VTADESVAEPSFSGGEPFFSANQPALSKLHPSTQKKVKVNAAAISVFSKYLIK
jgi:hypothetical protein